MAGDIAALIKHLKLDRPDVMGYSMGGGVAMFVAVALHVDAIDLFQSLLTNTDARAAVLGAVRGVEVADLDAVAAHPGRHLGRHHAGQLAHAQDVVASELRVVQPGHEIGVRPAGAA